MNQTLLRAPLLFLGLAAAACSSSSGSPAAAVDASTGDGASASDATPGPDAGEAGDAGATPDAGGPDSGLPADLVAFCGKYATAYCADQTACALATASVATCVAQSNNLCLDQVSSILGALSSGRMVFDPTAVDTCLADAQKPFCATNNLGSGVASCAKVFRGTVPTGGTCYPGYFILLNGGDHAGECATGVCSGATIQTCPGQCVDFLAMGAACTTTGTVSCVTGTYCDGAQCAPVLGLGATCDGKSFAECQSPLVCGPHDADGGAAFVCETPKAQGQGCDYDIECDRSYCLTGTCRPGHQGEECTAYLSCDTGLVCVGAAGCQAPIAMDASCDPVYGGCASGLACETVGTDDAGIPVGACHAVRTPTAGQPCFLEACADGYWCDESAGSGGTCRSPGAVGQPCDPSTAGTCATGLACNGAKVCQTRNTTGGACDPEWTSTCADGYGCGSKMTCEPKVGAGAACDASALCPRDYYCDGTCKPAKLPGTACTNITGECLGGACDTTRMKCNGDCRDPG